MDVAKGGIIVAAILSEDSSLVPSNIAQDTNTAIESGFYIGALSAQFATAQTGLAISISANAGGSDAVAAFAVMR
jgi:hypothetical protein